MNLKLFYDTETTGLPDFKAPAHWRRIGDAEPEVGAVVRDDRTVELFGEVETICALAEMLAGAVISGALLMAARKEWR